ncbi:MAG: N-acetyl-1-D-myo-inositol-2-amino-2-deoxy-alpha-D-glucopyranoside deacetylase [Chloroflexi bacterium]|nr:N-acetyl-1-D-myo-inositol-2-amino-2-deoxy-alpha-D-glucopyranoside deacetylase [Chloroflexota bacterium]
MTNHRPRTLMTVHAHPDDETIGTGGLMAKAVRDGHRVVLVTGTRGELGEIVVPEMDTPDNHRRLGEIRAGELEAAMAELGVTEWENLGYRDSGMMGTEGNRDPRCFWQADPDEAARRLTWFVRRDRPEVMTTYNDFGGYGHPDHIRVHDVSVRAFARAGDPAWYPEQLAPEHGGTGPAGADGGLAPWSPSKLYEQAIPASVRNAMRDQMEAAGEQSFWSEPTDASPEELEMFRERMAKMLVPDESITTWIDVADVIDRKWAAILHHVTQLSREHPFLRFGPDAWREFWSKEAYVLRESRVASPLPETDVFAGLD